MDLSLEGLAFALADDRGLGPGRGRPDRRPDAAASTSTSLDLPGLVAIFPGDDMGFKTGTLISPGRPARVRPALARPVRRAGPRRRAALLPPLLRQPGRDHAAISSTTSASTASTPSRTSSCRPRSSRPAGAGGSPTLGGVDLNILAGGTEDDVRRRTRRADRDVRTARPLRRRLGQLHPQLRAGPQLPGHARRGSDRSRLAPPAEPKPAPCFQPRLRTDRLIHVQSRARRGLVS